MTDPLLDGVVVDEFFNGESEKFAAWTKAVRRIRGSERFKGDCSILLRADVRGQGSRDFTQP